MDTRIVKLCLPLAGWLMLGAAWAEPAATNAPLKQLGPTTFQIGKVQFDKARKRITFPAAVNMTNGNIEYLIVTTTGKTHESLLRTEAQPMHLQLALLLLGAKGAGTNEFPEDSAKPIPGDKISIQISWTGADGTKKTFPGEDFVRNQQSGEKASRGPWVYNGSRVFQGVFLAQDIGSIVSVMTDPDALINNPRPGHENDKIWEVLGAGLPGLNWPVEVTFELR